MCLIVFAWQVVPGIPLIAAANRDEFYARATAPAGWWEKYPNLYAGRDLQAGGTWMGITQDSVASPKFAAVTNIRTAAQPINNALSRGTLVTDYLLQKGSAQEYIAEIAPHAHAYNGFNLLVGDCHTLIWFSNQGEQDARNGLPLQPGIYGLSNASLDPPWHKVIKTKAQFASLLCQSAPPEAYFEMLADTTRAPDIRLPDTGVDLEQERVLSSVRINSPTYGTRSSTLAFLYEQEPAVLLEKIIQ